MDKHIVRENGLIKNQTSKTIIQYLEKEIPNSSLCECSIVTSLGGTIELNYSKSKPTKLKNISSTLEVYKYIKNQSLDEIHFITVRPSPEYIYSLNKKIPSFQHQINTYSSVFLFPKVKVITVSIETGNSKILHYHLIVQCKEKTLKKYLKKLKNNSTYLHKINNNGYQAAVYLSETQSHNLIKGILYFHGLKIDVDNTTVKRLWQKTDYYNQLH